MPVITRTAAIAALLLTAACSGQPEVLEPGPDASVSASASASAAPPKMPEQASEDSEEGAASFAAHWIDMFNFASQTGNATELRRISSDCASCLKFADSAESLEAEERPTTGPWTIRSTVVSKDKIASDVKFELELLGGDTSTIAFELTPAAPYSVTDLYRVDE